MADEHDSQKYSCMNTIWEYLAHASPERTEYAILDLFKVYDNRSPAQRLKYLLEKTSMKDSFKDENALKTAQLAFETFQKASAPMYGANLQKTLEELVKNLRASMNTLLKGPNRSAKDAVNFTEVVKTFQSKVVELTKDYDTIAANLDAVYRLVSSENYHLGSKIADLVKAKDELASRASAASKRFMSEFDVVLTWRAGDKYNNPMPRLRYKKDHKHESGYMQSSAHDWCYCDVVWEPSKWLRADWENKLSQNIEGRGENQDFCITKGPNDQKFDYGKYHGLTGLFMDSIFNQEDTDEIRRVDSNNSKLVFGDEKFEKFFAKYNASTDKIDNLYTGCNGQTNTKIKLKQLTFAVIKEWQAISMAHHTGIMLRKAVKFVDELKTIQKQVLPYIERARRDMQAVRNGRNAMLAILDDCIDLAYLSGSNEIMLNAMDDLGRSCVEMATIKMKLIDADSSFNVFDPKVNSFSFRNEYRGHDIRDDLFPWPTHDWSALAWDPVGKKNFEPPRPVPFHFSWRQRLGGLSGCLFAINTLEFDNSKPVKFNVCITDRTLTGFTMHTESAMTKNTSCNDLQVGWIPIVGALKGTYQTADLYAWSIAEDATNWSKQVNAATGDTFIRDVGMSLDAALQLPSTKVECWLKGIDYRNVIVYNAYPMGMGAMGMGKLFNKSNPPPKVGDRLAPATENMYWEASVEPFTGNNNVRGARFRLSETSKKQLNTLGAFVLAWDPVKCYVHTETFTANLVNWGSGSEVFHNADFKGLFKDAKRTPRAMVGIKAFKAPAFWDGLRIQTWVKSLSKDGATVGIKCWGDAAALLTVSVVLVVM